MLEIVFTDSAYGVLKVAQSFGKGKYQGSCIGIFIDHGDGTEPTQAEIDEARQKLEAEERKKWEHAVPLGGTASDVYGFSLGLSIGDVRDPMCVQDRLNAFKVQFGFWNMQLEQDMIEELTRYPKAIDEVMKRVADGEDVRIWYSDIPDELCGFYWILNQLRSLPKGHGTVYALKQPSIYESEDRILYFRGWGDMEPGQLYKFTQLAVPVSDVLCRCYGNLWKKLQEENASIRACVNGNLISAPDNLYDFYILKEISTQPNEFREAIVVGNVLGKYNLGISDGYIHYRISKMVDEGTLIAVTVPKKDDPGYWRILRKA